MTRAADRLRTALQPVRRAVLARRRLLAALFAVVAVAAGIRAAQAPPLPTATLFVAAADLPAGQVVSASDLGSVEVPPGSLPSGLVDDPVGRVLAGPVRRGEPLTDVRLVGPDLTEGHPELIALPVRLPDSAMAGLLRAGDRIDLVGSDPQGDEAQQVATDALVLALPPPDDQQSASGLPGRLVVLGVSGSEVTAVSQAAVRLFLTYAYSR